MGEEFLFPPPGDRDCLLINESFDELLDWMSPWSVITRVFQL